MLPTLVEVYAASVALHVRHKAINGILKIISFVDPESLGETLDNVPLASFLAAILSSRDHPTLVNGALRSWSCSPKSFPRCTRHCCGEKV